MRIPPCDLWFSDFPSRILPRKILILFSLLYVFHCSAQSIKGTIINYPEQPLFLYLCYGDSLIYRDSTVTTKAGEFLFEGKSFSGQKNSPVKGLYKIGLPHNQFFYIIVNEAKDKVEIETQYSPSAFYNIATDSLVVNTSEENKRFFEFQKLQKSLNIANYWLLQMMRVYPLHDPFHPSIEKEYSTRYESIKSFAEKQMKKFPDAASTKIASAYYIPELPDWKMPDPERDKIMADHYFDYFNPADSFYLNSNILHEKANIWVSMRTNLVDSYGQPIRDEMIKARAIKDFIDKTWSNRQSANYLLQQYLKKFDKDKQYNALLFVYDSFFEK